MSTQNTNTVMHSASNKESFPLMPMRKLQSRIRSAFMHLSRNGGANGLMNLRINPQLCTISNGVDMPMTPLESWSCQELEESAASSTSLREAGVSHIEWVDLMMLPGAQMSSLCALGFAIFKHFGMAEDSRVLAVSSLKDAPLTHSNMELNAVLGYLESFAVKLSRENMKLHFDGTIEGYSPDARVYYLNGKGYLALSEDGGGNYIYAFDCPETPRLSR